MYQVSKETGVSAVTINNWIENHEAGRLDLDSAEHLPLWEQELAAMVQDKQNALKTENTNLKKEKKQLEKDLRAKERELASETEKEGIPAFVYEAKPLGVAERSTCGFLGITVRTIQNWRSKGLRDKLPPQQQACPHCN